jgi:hypothetical protein
MASLVVWRYHFLQKHMSISGKKKIKTTGFANADGWMDGIEWSTSVRTY